MEGKFLFSVRFAGHNVNDSTGNRNCMVTEALVETRKQGYVNRGFDTMFSPDVTLEQDLERRDLTINAIATALRNSG